jgi:hypothetical protein
MEDAKRWCYQTTNSEEGDGVYVKGSWPLRPLKSRLSVGHFVKQFSHHPTARKLFVSFLQLSESTKTGTTGARERIATFQDFFYNFIWKRNPDFSRDFLPSIPLFSRLYSWLSKKRGSS